MVINDSEYYNNDKNDSTQLAVSNSASPLPVYYVFFTLFEQFGDTTAPIYSHAPKFQILLEFFHTEYNCVYVMQSKVN